MEVKFVKINENGQVPVRNKTDEGAAGYDVKSGIEYTLYPNETKVIGTGVKCALPANTFAMIASRSGLSIKGIVVQNAPGIIDQTYRGEWGVILHNYGENPFKINIGDRIAQCVLMSYNTMEFKEVDTLDETSRGSNGFGSSGV